MDTKTKQQSQTKDMEHVVILRHELAAQNSSQFNNENMKLESFDQVRETRPPFLSSSSTSSVPLDMKHSANESKVSDQITQLIILFSPMMLMVFMFYVLIWRPQYKSRQTRIKMIQNLQQRDKIILDSGLYGTIHKIHDKYIEIIIYSDELGHNVIVQCAKDAVKKMQ